MEIYLTDISWLTEEPAYRRMCGFVPAERRERIARCRRAPDRARGLGAGLLLEYGLRKRGLTLLDGVPDCRRAVLERGQYGKPYLAGETGVFFNLSHAGSYAAAVFAGEEAGIDIERIREAKKGMAERFFAEEEAAYLGRMLGEDALNTAFIRIWTRKESYIKAAGEGLHLPLDRFCVLGESVCRPARADGETGHDGSPAGKREAGYALRTWEMPAGYVLSVCAASMAEEAERAEPEVVEPPGLTECLCGRMEER